jgi:tellurite resistance protein
MRQDRTIAAYAGRIAGRLCNIVQKCAPLFDRAAQRLGFETNHKEPTISQEPLRCAAVEPDDIAAPGIDCDIAVEPDPCGEEVFTVKIRGRICADQPGRRAYLTAKLNDVTDPTSEPTTVYVKPDRSSTTPSKPFGYTCDLGRLNENETHISDWISVAKVSPVQIVLARKGKRRLRLSGQILCRETGSVLARCGCEFLYDNSCWGYLDTAENIQRANALAVTLAFSLSAADGRMYKSEIDTIKSWAHSNLALQSSKSAHKQLDRALRTTIRFFRTAHKVDAAALAGQLTDIAPLPQRYDIVEMCLNVVESKGFVSAGQVQMLKKLSGWLGLDPGRFRDMLDRLAPANTHQVKDIELIFGLSSKMNARQSRERLNKEYRKWNSRTTSVDPAVKNQAEQMLQLIAEARGRQTT